MSEPRTPSQSAPPTKLETHEARLHHLQLAWFRGTMGKPIVVRLIDGSELTGTLRGYDTYSIEVEDGPSREHVLLFKHGILTLRLG